MRNSIAKFGIELRYHSHRSLEWRLCVFYGIRQYFRRLLPVGELLIPKTRYLGTVLSGEKPIICVMCKDTADIEPSARLETEYADIGIALLEYLQIGRNHFRVHPLLANEAVLGLNHHLAGRAVVLTMSEQVKIVDGIMRNWRRAALESWREDLGERRGRSPDFLKAQQTKETNRAPLADSP